MNSNTCCNQGCRWAGVVAVLAVMALLTAACGGTSTGAGGSSSTGASTLHQEELAVARCMRSHGVPNFPDPDSVGLRVPHSMTQLPQYQRAYQACKSLLPRNAPVKGAAPGGGS